MDEDEEVGSWGRGIKGMGGIGGRLGIGRKDLFI